MAITASDFQNIELAISAYADEMYTFEKPITGTEMMYSNPNVRVDGEDYIGQMREFNPVNANFNTPSLTDPTDGAFSDITSKVSTYIKGMSAMAFDNVNLHRVVTQQDVFNSLGMHIAQNRAKDRNDCAMAVLRGIGNTEADNANGGLVEFGDYDDNTKGFFVDLNADGHFGAAATGPGDSRRLVDSSAVGASRVSRLLEAIGMGFADYEPDFMYLVTSPEMMAEFRQANLVDETTVTDGNVEFQTILGGKFRLQLTRASQGDVSTSANVNAESTKVTYLVKPNAISFTDIPLENAVEIDRNASSFLGGGNTELWSRWGHIVHPKGYSWTGAQTAFANSTTYEGAVGAPAWARNTQSMLNLSVLPILHS